MEKVDIRPGVAILGVLSHVDYTPWHALAEFVDNSLDSYLRNKEDLVKINGDDYRLSVDIHLDLLSHERITIRDNAAGIQLSDFGRAFKTATVPINQGGLAEFGMGMKSAACWFAPDWSVRTKALGDNTIRTVRFNVEDIVEGEIEELDIEEEICESDDHFTEILLENVRTYPVGRTVGKIRDHLSGMYRNFIREGDLELIYDTKPLEYDEPAILIAPHFKDKEGDEITWKKDINLNLGDNRRVHGFAALREVGSTTHAGFSLFRRGRVIDGSGDQGYRPREIFGHSNSYRYQRLFGELHLEGFDVSYTKNGFKWNGNEENFLNLLRDELTKGDLDLLAQAEGYRTRPPKDKFQKNATKVVKSAYEVFEKNGPSILPLISVAPPVDVSSEDRPHEHSVARKEFIVEFTDERWKINIEFTDEDSDDELIIFSDIPQSGEDLRKLDIRISRLHPFMDNFTKADIEVLETILRMSAALCVSIVAASDIGVEKTGTILRNFNILMHGVFSEIL